MNKKFDASAVGTVRVGVFVVFTPTEAHLQLLDDAKVIDERLDKAREANDMEMVNACVDDRTRLHEMLVATLHECNESRVLAIHGMQTKADSPEPTTVQELDEAVWDAHTGVVVRERQQEAFMRMMGAMQRGEAAGEATPT